MLALRFHLSWIRFWTFEHKNNNKTCFFYNRSSFVVREDSQTLAVAGLISTGFRMDIPICINRYLISVQVSVLGFCFLILFYINKVFRLYPYCLTFSSVRIYFRVEGRCSNEMAITANTSVFTIFKHSTINNVNKIITSTKICKI